MCFDLDIVHGDPKCRDALVLVIHHWGQAWWRIDSCCQAALEEDPEDLVVLDALRILGVPQVLITSPFTHVLGELRED